MIPWIVGGAIDVVEALKIGKVERHVGLAKKMRASLLQLAHVLGILRGDVVPHRGHAPGGCRAGQIEGLLGRHGYTVKRPNDPALSECCIGCPCGGTRAFEVPHNHGVDRPIHAFDAENEMIRELQRADVFAPNRFSKCRRGTKVQIGHVGNLRLDALNNAHLSIVPSRTPPLRNAKDIP